MEVELPGPPQSLDNFTATEVIAKDSVDIPDINEQDLKFATDQSFEPVDPMDEITNQIQKEIEAEKIQQEKKEKLEKLIEITNQLKIPDWDEDFDV